MKDAGGGSGRGERIVKWGRAWYCCANDGFGARRGRDAGRRGSS